MCRKKLKENLGDVFFQIDPVQIISGLADGKDWLIIPTADCKLNLIPVLSSSEELGKSIEETYERYQMLADTKDPIPDRFYYYSCSNREMWTLKLLNEISSESDSEQKNSSQTDEKENVKDVLPDSEKPLFTSKSEEESYYSESNRKA